MSAEAVGRAMPVTITLADVAAMNADDRYGHRYELSPEGVLSVVPAPEVGHAVIATRLTAWLIRSDWPVEQVLQAAGIRLSGPDGDGGRIPDLTVWSRPQQEGAVWPGTDDLLLAIEIVSRGSAAIDQIAKVAEYAAAGIPQYWTVDRDAAQTVTMYRLHSGRYETAMKVPLAWLLRTSPREYLPSADGEPAVRADS
jgi:Uma2 family endonuclease